MYFKVKAGVGWGGVGGCQQLVDQKNLFLSPWWSGLMCFDLTFWTGRSKKKKKKLDRSYFLLIGNCVVISTHPSICHGLRWGQLQDKAGPVTSPSPNNHFTLTFAHWSEISVEQSTLWVQAVRLWEELLAFRGFKPRTFWLEGNHHHPYMNTGRWIWPTSHEPSNSQLAANLSDRKKDVGRASVPTSTISTEPERDPFGYSAT